jgi:hypothetical protein
VTQSGGRRITTREATVKTATVEIKTLTVGGKQVTLSMFRQIKREPLLDADTAQLGGVPWGTVNYHPERCHGASEHLHVVWQKGDELRRSWTPRRWTEPEDRVSDRQSALSDLETAFDLALVSVLVSDRLDRIGVVRIKDNHILATIAGLTLERSGYGKLAPLVGWLGLAAEKQAQARAMVADERLRNTWPATLWVELHKLHASLAESLAPSLTEVTVPPTFEDATAVLAEHRQAYREECAVQERDRRAWAEQYAALEALDQLFIAV